MGPVVQRMQRDAGISFPEEQNSENGHQRRRRRHRSDLAKPEVAAAEENNATNEKIGHDTGHDRDEIDLESGLAHTNGLVH